MKKILIASALALSAITSFAASALIEVNSANGVDQFSGSNGTLLLVKEQINTLFTGDVSLSAAQSKETKTLSNRAEVGLTYSRPIGPVSVLTRVAVGTAYKSGTNDPYYSIEPGVTYAFTDKLSGNVSYRYRTGFSENTLDTTDTYRIGALYALTTKDSIGIRYDRIRGDYKQNQVALQYTRGF